MKKTSSAKDTGFRLKLSLLIFLLVIAIAAGLCACSKKGDNKMFDSEASEFGTLIEGGKIICIPTPLKVEVFSETSEIKDGDKIFIDTDNYSKAAENFISYVEEAFGIKLETCTDKKEGNIIVLTDNNLETEEYKLAIKDTVNIRVSCQDGANRAFATILEYLTEAQKGENVYTVKNLRVFDKPDKEYRGVMLDTARSFISVERIKEMIRNCYLNKINYLHIHFSDTVYFTFPWSLMEEHMVDGWKYTKEELEDLEAYADGHGVTIVPEIDIPSHQGPLLEAFPEIFTSCELEQTRHEICLGKEEVYEKINGLIDELCAIFKRTPYIHFGCDEVGYDVWENCPTCKEYRDAHGIYGIGNNANGVEHLRHFMNRVAEMIKNHGKTPALWESFMKSGIIEVDKDIVVYAYQSYFNLAPDLVAGGYKIINCATTPMYYVPYGKIATQEEIYDWNVYNWKCAWEGSPASVEGGISVEPTDQVIGTQVCCWETQYYQVYVRLAQRLPTMCERVWRLEKQGTYDEYVVRYEALEDMIETICNYDI
ncbi:MAG: family 20 glycosylhydrolase [Oscillospiraceae bacterium]|nr:family 20 glycosylhydrolase [Oscillospiraceae bacterium]